MCDGVVIASKNKDKSLDNIQHFVEPQRPENQGSKT